jgi:hypothetical protein
VRKYKHIKELLAGESKRLSALRSQSRDRSVVLEHVRSALPKELAQAVASAGILKGTLTIGVASGAFASRLRYVTEELGKRVGESRGIDIQAVRIRVVPPRS